MDKKEPPVINKNHEHKSGISNENKRIQNLLIKSTIRMGAEAAMATMAKRPRGMAIGGLDIHTDGCNINFKLL